MMEQCLLRGPSQDEKRAVGERIVQVLLENVQAVVRRLNHRQVGVNPSNRHGQGWTQVRCRSSASRWQRRGSPCPR